MSGGLVSVIVPTKNSERTIEQCLDSIKNQTYKDVEIIVVDTFSKDRTREIAGKYGAKLIIGHYNKPEARNTGFLNSTGNIIIFADSDFIFSNNVIEDTVEQIKNGFDAVIIPEKILNSNLIGKIRNLEKETYIGDRLIEAARAYTRNVVNEIGLFDEKMVGPDEYDFYSKVIEANCKIGRITSIIYISESPFWNVLKKKFNHGRYWRIYSKKHTNTAAYQMSSYIRLEKLNKALSKNLFLGGALFFIKGLESLFFFSGILTSYFDRQIIKLENNIATKYDSEAEFYEQRMYHSNAGTEYVNSMEKEAALLSVKRYTAIDNTILDVGAGNGRWSRELLKSGLKVVALDVSEKMCECLKNSINHQNFKVNHGTIERTEFNDEMFDAVFSFRSFKYVYDDTKGLFEINRILKDNGALIIEIPNYFNPFYFPLYFSAPFLRYLIKKDFLEYMCNIKMYSTRTFKKKAEENGFKIEKVVPLFFFPHGVFAKVKNGTRLKIISKIDKTFCNTLTARSLMFVLKKEKMNGTGFLNPTVTAAYDRKEIGAMEINRGLVSVIVPTKNSSDTIEICLKSIKNQTYPDIEIIVVDNYSVDETVSIAREQGAKVFTKGPERSTQVNFGIKNASGKYIYRVDSDFILYPNIVSECVEQCEGKGYDAIAVHNTSDPTISFWSKVRNLERDCYRDDELNIGARFIKRDIFNEIGMFDENLVAGEDYDLHNRLIGAGFKVGKIKSQEVHIGEPKSLWEIAKKHYYYGTTIGEFIKRNPKKARQQLTPFRSSYLRHWKDFLMHPILTIGFIIYQSVRYSSAGVGFLSTKLREKNENANHQI